MIRHEIARRLTAFFGPLPDRHEVVRTPRNQPGDYTSNAPFLAAPARGVSPDELARQFIGQFTADDLLAAVELGGRGFLNFHVQAAALDRALAALDPATLGVAPVGRGRRVLVEFVSANPTGPLNIVSARAGVLGDAIVRLLRRVGSTAESEFYCNDTGVQIDLLVESFRARRAELAGRPATIPEGGYPGAYLIDLARAADAAGVAPDAERAFVLEQLVGQQQQSLARLGIVFDRWVWEHEIRPLNDETLALLRARGAAYDAEGATWFRATAHGDREDRVLVKRTGEPTYFFTDLSYHRHKQARGYDQLVDILGPDHHGDIARLLGGYAALGGTPGTLEIVIAQQTTLRRGNEKVTMSKRAGEYVTLDDVLDEVGPDALKFFLLMRRPSQHLDFDLALAAQSSMENPVYYVQYAHARIAAIRRHAGRSDDGWPTAAQAARLTAPEERDLVKTILDFAPTIANAALTYEPHRVVYFLIDLARDFHHFYEQHRVVGSDQEMTRARLALCRAAQQALAAGLQTLGMHAPDSM